MLQVLLVFVGLPILITGERNCSADNGGCSHYCIDRTSGGNDGVCGCGCYYQLDTDAETCIPISPCTVDMLWMFDFSNGITSSCPTLAIPGLPVVVDLTAFTVFRGEVSTYYQEFSSEIASGEFRIATMISGANLFIQNNYGDIASSTVLTNQIINIPANSTGICGSDNVFEALFNSFDNQVQAANILAPTGGGDPSNTTRVAVVAFITPLDESSYDLPTMNDYAAAIHGYYDQVFVIGRKDISELGIGFRPLIEPQMRHVACNSRTADPCAYLFYADGTNDVGVKFDDVHSFNLIDREACITRRPAFSHSTTCGENMTITIPSCILGGLLASDLQLNDPSCSTYSTTTSGDNITLNVEYDACAPVTSTEEIDGITYITIKQTVSSKDYGTGSSILPVSLEAECIFPHLTDEQLGFFNPVVEEVTGIADEIGNFDLELRLYQDDSYSSYYTDFTSGIDIGVLDAMYFLVTANLPTNTELIVQNVIASSSTDRNAVPNHVIMENQCPSDSTFSLTTISYKEVRFSFDMFEFSNTLTEPNGEKTPVYVHVTLRVCDVSDNSENCNQRPACTKRRKRDTSDNNTPHRTIGPFYFASKPSTKNQVVAQSAVGGNITPEKTKFDPSLEIGAKRAGSAFQIYIVSPGLGMLCVWFLLVVSTAAIVSLISKCILKQSPAKALHHHYPISTSHKSHCADERMKL